MVFKVKGMNEAIREMSVEERRCPKAEPHNISGLEDKEEPATEIRGSSRRVQTSDLGANQAGENNIIPACLLQWCFVIK